MKKWKVYLAVGLIGILSLSGCKADNKIAENKPEQEQKIVDPCEETGVKPLREEDQKYFEVSQFNVKEFDLLDEKTIKGELKKLAENSYQSTIIAYGGFEEELIGVMHLKINSKDQIELEIYSSEEENSRTGFKQAEESKKIILDINSEDFKNFTNYQSDSWKDSSVTKQLLEVYEIAVEKEETVKEEPVKEESVEGEVDGAVEGAVEENKAEEKAVTEESEAESTLEKKEENIGDEEKQLKEQFVKQFMRSLTGYVELLSDMQKDDTDVGTYLNCRKAAEVTQLLEQLKSYGFGSEKDQAPWLLAKQFMSASKLAYDKGNMTINKGVFAMKSSKYVNREPQTDREYAVVILY